MGAFATSYIKTEGSAVTRADDAASMTGANFSSWYRADEGTLYAESQLPSNVAGLTAVLCAASDGTASNRVQLSYIASNLRAINIVSGSDQSGTNLQESASDSNTPYKAAFGIKLDSLAFSLNGSSVKTDPTALVPVVNRLDIGSRANSFVLNGTIRKIAYYPKRLANAEIVALTQN